LIPEFLSEPKYLGEYRKTFELAWNFAVEALKTRSMEKRVKLDISAYWANLMVCTPTWRRMGIEIYNQDAVHFLRSTDELSRKKGKSDRKLTEAIEALDRGQIKLETEADFIRAESARGLIKYAWKLYNADWYVFENDTDTEYITSDNPASFEDQGDAVISGVPPFIRFLPVTPRLCLMCDLTKNPKTLRDTKPDFEQEPSGTVHGGLVAVEMVHRINTAVAKCAEELVLASNDNKYVRELTEKYSKFRVEHQSARFSVPRGFLIQNRTRVVERK
jgi:hypothetical protein